MSWLAIQACLDDPKRMGKFIDCVEETMNHRERVNIKHLVQRTVEELGEEYRDRIFHVLITAAARTKIEIVTKGATDDK
jgi:hypothetical protein